MFATDLDADTIQKLKTTIKQACTCSFFSLFLILFPVFLLLFAVTSDFSFFQKRHMEHRLYITASTDFAIYFAAVARGVDK
jgi:hypothetical protein